ncbi:MAG: PAS domain S-box protein [Candidatus Lokiarchaeota archaeon]|nr:PAS domain S-box protein [Candidatus Lokiarchaeota archaeon]
MKNYHKEFNDLFEKAPFSIILLDLNGKIIKVNSSTEKIFGYTIKELIGVNYLKLSVYPIELLPLLRERLKKAGDGIPLKPEEFQIYKRDGSVAWVMSFISLIKTADSSIIQAIILDISDRKKIEMLLRERIKIEKTISTISSRFVCDTEIDSAIFSSLKDMGSLYNATRAYILLFNDVSSLDFFAQVQCDNSEEIPKIDLKSIDPLKYPWIRMQFEKLGYIFIENIHDLPKNVDQTRDMLENLKIKSLLAFPLNIKGENRGFIVFDNIKENLKWDPNNSSSIQTCAEIISNALDLKWSKETLKGSHQLLDGIISSLTEMICLIDRELNIIWANNAAKNIFGINLSGKKCYEVFQHQNKPCENCIGLRTFLDGLIHENENKMMDVDNNIQYWWATSNTAALDLDGETELVILIFRDITKRKEIELSLEASEKKLKSLNKILVQKVEERTSELKTSEEKYKKMLNELDVGFYKGEFKGKLLMHNQTLNKILGIELTKSLVGTSTSQFFSDTNTQSDYYNKLLTDGSIQNFIAELIIPSGEKIRAQLNSHLIRDRDGKPKEVEGTIIKI